MHITTPQDRTHYTIRQNILYHRTVHIIPQPQDSTYTNIIAQKCIYNRTVHIIPYIIPQNCAYYNTTRQNTLHHTTEYIIPQDCTYYTTASGQYIYKYYSTEVYIQQDCTHYTIYYITELCTAVYHILYHIYYTTGLYILLDRWLDRWMECGLGYTPKDPTSTGGFSTEGASSMMTMSSWASL